MRKRTGLLRPDSRSDSADAIRGLLTDIMWLIGVLPNEVHCCTSREHVPQGFRFSDATGRITQSVIDQPVDPLQDLAIRPLPVCLVVPTVGRESEPHATSSCSWRSPDRACWRLSSRRLALEGTRSRYAVSSRAANSSAEMRTALPRRDVISVLLHLTCSRARALIASITSVLASA